MTWPDVFFDNDSPNKIFGMTQIISDRLAADAALQELDIWQGNGNVDGFRVTALLRRLLINGTFGEFEETLCKLESEKFQPKISIRLTRARGQFDNLRSVLQQAEKSLNYQQVLLTPFNNTRMEINTLENIFEKEPGLYVRKGGSGCYEGFEQDFADCDAHKKSLLRESGFARPMRYSGEEKYRVIHFAKFHTFHHHFYAVSDSNGFYDSTNAARLAQLSGVNFLSNGLPCILEKAIILPIDYVCGNYYHNLAECFSGLRFLADLPPDVPVIYTEDRFGILDFMASRLRIDRKRFISIKELGNVIVKIAIQLYPGSFWGESAIYAFQRTIAYPQTRSSRIYISRRKSSRGPSNEMAVEEALQDLGFEILFLEDIDFPQQVLAFSNAHVVVAPHGAGLANMVFAPPGGGVVEILKSSYVQSDYYFRTRHSRTKYACVIQYGDEMNIAELRKEVQRFL